MPPTDFEIEVERPPQQCCRSARDADSIWKPELGPLNIPKPKTRGKDLAPSSELSKKKKATACVVSAPDPLVGMSHDFGPLLERRGETVVSHSKACASTCQPPTPAPRKINFRKAMVQTEKQQLPLDSDANGQQHAVHEDHSAEVLESTECTKASPLDKSLSVNDKGATNGCPRGHTTGEGRVSGRADGVIQSGADRASARRRAAEKREAIRQDHMKRRSEARKRRSNGHGDGAAPANIAGTVLFRPKDRSVSFRVLPRPTIVKELEDVRGVAAVRVNFQRNVVAVDGVEHSAVLALLATDSICGLDVVGRELAARPGTSSGVIYDHYDVKGSFTAEEMAETEIVSCVPVISSHPTELGCSLLLRFDAPSPPPDVVVKKGFWGVEMDVKPNRPRPLQCSNCGRFNHATASCLHPSRCMRCAKSGDHSLDSCTSEPKCGNCGRPHAMTDRRCRIWKQERRVEAALTAPNVTSRPLARQSVRAEYTDLWPRAKKVRRRRTEQSPLKKKEKVQVALVPSVFLAPSSSEQNKANLQAAPAALKTMSPLASVQCPAKQALENKKKADKGKHKASSEAKSLPSLCSNLPHHGKAKPGKGPTCQKKTTAQHGVDTTKVRPKGQLCFASAPASGKATSMQRSTTMPSSRPSGKQSTAAALSQWSSTPHEVVHGAASRAHRPERAPVTSKCCGTSIPPPVDSRASGGRDQSKKTSCAGSKTGPSPPGQFAPVASSSGASSSKNGASAKAAPCDQEEAFLGVLAQLAAALQAGYNELAPPPENCKPKKKGGGKKKR